MRIAFDIRRQLVRGSRIELNLKNDFTFSIVI